MARRHPLQHNGNNNKFDMVCVCIKVCRMDDQQWETIVIRKKGNTKTSQSAAKPPVSQATKLMRALDSEGPVKVKILSSDSRQEIVRARAAASMNQVQLNTACSFPSNIIRDIESGRIIPTPQQLNVLNRVLKLALKYTSV